MVKLTAKIKLADQFSRIDECSVVAEVIYGLSLGLVFRINIFWDLNAKWPKSNLVLCMFLYETFDV